MNSDGSATGGEVIALWTRVTISDPSNVVYQTPEPWDSDGTVVGGEFKINNVAQPAGRTINVSPANVANTVFDAGAGRCGRDRGTRVGFCRAGDVRRFDRHAAARRLEGFSGTGAELSGQDALDLRDIAFATIKTPTYSGNSSGGTLTMTDSPHSANIALLGNYLASSFVASSDRHGGTDIVDPRTDGLTCTGGHDPAAARMRRGRHPHRRTTRS